MKENSVHVLNVLQSIASWHVRGSTVLHVTCPVAIITVPVIQTIQGKKQGGRSKHY